MGMATKSRHGAIRQSMGIVPPAHPQIPLSIVQLHTSGIPVFPAYNRNNINNNNTTSDPPYPEEGNWEKGVQYIDYFFYIL